MYQHLSLPLLITISFLHPLLEFHRSRNEIVHLLVRSVICDFSERIIAGEKQKLYLKYAFTLWINLLLEVNRISWFQCIFPFYFRVHERRHRENTKTKSCPFCTATFEHKFHLKQHIERKHARKELTCVDNDDVE